MPQLIESNHEIKKRDNHLRTERIVTSGKSLSSYSLH